MSLERLMINSRATSTWALVALLFSAGVHAEKERLKISGQVLMDIDYYESFWDKSGDSSNTNLELRNGRIQFTYDFPAGWEAKLQVNTEADSDGSDIDLGSAYIRYTNWKHSGHHLGQNEGAPGHGAQHSQLPSGDDRRFHDDNIFYPSKELGHTSKRCN